MYSGSLIDSLQLAITISCLSLLVIITVVYVIYFNVTGDKAFLAGALVTCNMMLYVLAETLIIICGWNNEVELGRHIHRAEQVGTFLFLASLPYFILHAFPQKGRMKRTVEFFLWTGLALTVVVSVAGYIFPESLISVKNASTLLQDSPADFTRGLEGPLYMVRDIGLAIYILMALAFSSYYIIVKNRSFQTLSIFFGLIIAILGGVDDIQRLYSGTNLLLNEIRFSRFVLGCTMMMMFFLAAVFSKYFTAHTMLKKTTRELEVSENKYSLLMDAANEIMFSLSEDLTIISANQKANQLLCLGGEDKNFMDCLYHSEYESKADNNLFKEQLVDLREAGEKLAFNTYIMDSVTKEPVEYHFRFDCFYDGENLELIGRAWPTAASKLVDYVGTERLSLDVDNYITMVSDIVDRLTANTKRYLEEGDVMMMKMGLQEMIINAMEHGNLNVTFDEKTEAQEDGRLFEFMSERRLLPEYRDRKVSIDYYFDATKVIYRITDMGPGFDYHKIMDRVKNEVNQQELSHGRGIIMTQAVFDKVEYNNKGNQVLLIKEFKKGDAA